MEVLVYLGIGREAFRAPEVRHQPGMERGIHIQKALHRRDVRKTPAKSRPVSSSLRGGGSQRSKRRLVISRNSACWAGMPASAKKDTESREPSIDFHPC